MANQRQVYTSVQVTNKDHPRFGQVGAVVGSEDPVQVKFDDGKVVGIAYDDLQGL